MKIPLFDSLVWGALRLTPTRCTYSQCMPRAHLMTFELTIDSVYGREYGPYTLSMNQQATRVH